ncbi:hypothetical protein DN069_20335 [Streptacidiphilus pinicola]|uniref:Uncharacterized protein n=2 Tax=Streptacidiphilus pinicola TaxID=2219663 RepID=A0A2X0K9L3_9ACTN|nr:hypothetical protein DN069_20335 [Streptacidiphilus pinicola]
MALPDWDYTTDIAMSRVVQVDLAELREDCGLPADAGLRLSVRYWPSTSLIKHAAFREILPMRGDKVACEIQVVAEGLDLGGELTIETLLELASDLPYSDPFVATRAGSILWSDQARMHLEGSAGLLPVAPVSFREAGLPPGAAWYVSMDGGDWQQAAMGSLLVLLNEDNPEIRRALEAEKKDAPGDLWGLLEVDIVCDLIGRALDDEAFLDEPAASHEDNGQGITMAGLVRALIRTYLARPGEGVDQAIKRLHDERRRDPSRFRADVQNGIGFPRDGQK